MQLHNVFVLFLDLLAVAVSLPILFTSWLVLRFYAGQVHERNRRRNIGYEQFERYFADAGAPVEITRSTYEILSQEVALARGMAIKPYDSLTELCGIGRFAGTGVPELAEWIADRSGRRLSFAPLQATILTVADLVFAVSAFPPVLEPRLTSAPVSGSIAVPAV